MKYFLLGFMSTIPLVLLMAYTVVYYRDDASVAARVGLLGGMIIGVLLAVPFITWFCSEWMVK